MKLALPTAPGMIVAILDSSIMEPPGVLSRSTYAMSWSSRRINAKSVANAFNSRRCYQNYAFLNSSGCTPCRPRSL